VALFDLDGTLVDSSYQHALSWFRALRRHGVTVPVWRIHRHIGMGGDQIVAALAGDDIEREVGDRLRDAEHEEFLRMRDECAPLAGANTLLRDLHERGVTIVMASSASDDDVQHFLDLLDAGDAIADWTTGDDVARSKPHPDIVNAALEKAGHGRDGAVMFGDSGWDVEAAAAAGLETVCVMTGGWAEQELRDAGAACVFQSLVELRERITETPLFIADGDQAVPATRP
jgi:HAD superfamily hydrolase (TIGR01509 family)